MLGGRLSVVAAAVLFSTGGAAIKACGLSAWQVAGFRSAFAMVAVFVLMRPTRWTRSGAATAVAYAATMVLFVYANKLTTAASSILLQSTAPLYMIPFARFVLHEPVRRRDLGFLGALLFGMILFFGDADARFATAPDPVRGNVVAAASAVFWALTVGGLRRLERDGEKEGAAATLVLGNAFAFLFCLPFALPLGAVSTSDGLLIAYLGIFQVGLAYVCLARGVRKVPGLEASFLLLLEPVLNPLWAWVVHGETPGPWTLAGGALVVGAAALKPWLDARSALTELRKRSLQRAS